MVAVQLEAAARQQVRWDWQGSITSGGNSTKENIAGRRPEHPVRWQE